MTSSRPAANRPSAAIIRLLLITVALAGAMLPLGSPVMASEIIIAAKEVEKTLDMRVGLSVIDTGSGHVTAYRETERFAMASTFKALACAAALSAGEDVLARKIPIRKADLRPHSPVTERRVGARISTRDLCAITLETSDNAAANLILKAIGGPEQLTAFLRRNGDETTRLDRYEPELNEAAPGDPRDTTTPQAMARTLQRLLLNDALLPQARQQLDDWMAANAVADRLIRSKLPEGWRIADRSGAGGHGTRGVIAVLRPPAAAPLVVAIYMDGQSHNLATRDAAIAEIAAAIFAEHAR